MKNLPKAVYAVIALLGLLAALSWATLSANLSDTYAYAGIVGVKAEGIPMSCGGTYQPLEKVAFSSTLPCGTKVTLLNPRTGAKATATVAHQDVVNNQLSYRAIDISPAVARELQLNPHALQAPVIGIRIKHLWAPVMRGLAYAQTPLASPEPRQTDLSLLTNTLLGECGNCGALGMVAVAQVVQNRVDSNFNGKSNIYGVIHDANQFSWVKLNPTVASARPNLKAARHVAKLFLQNQLSGDALAIQYRTGKATHYYAFALINTPAWGRSAKLEKVKLPNWLEAELQHRFFAPVDTPTYRLASR